ncbi:hypothetical protein [Prevotella merdae]|uniref:hypothetical protein n=1 Tax=Prevotella merdae TaxID=2079531 RepID=UPI003F7E9D22
MNGYKVQLEGLGNVIFTPDSKLENLINDAVFNPMPSRVAQAAVLKAEKNGDVSVDLEAIKKKGNWKKPLRELRHACCRLFSLRGHPLKYILSPVCSRTKKEKQGD